ncbi:MAG: GIY-YIG nuclease family protein, partial [bacterium]|nr:GIY-YIG nuclease family protein [bacterium]
MGFRKIILEKIKKAPKTPGVYVFYDRKNILYIGKASNLKNRLKSYLKAGDFKNARLQENATNLKLIRLRSEIEALIEEAKLIKKYNPPYNVLWRDDKTYFYVLFTGDKFPRVFVVHKNRLPTTNHSLPTINAIGPFTDGRALRLVLRMLRRYFPYCTCPKPHLRICLNAQIGNCFGFCCIAHRSVGAKEGIAHRSVGAKEGRKDSNPATEQSRQYRKNIRVIKNFLLGKSKVFSKNLNPVRGRAPLGARSPRWSYGEAGSTRLPARAASNEMKFEEKSALEKILAHREFLEYTLMDADETQINADTKNNISENLRKSAILIECYDISHLSGKETVAGMTAWSFADGKLLPRKNFWRKFIIRTAKSGDDPAAMYEAVSRRLNHPEWPYPNLIVIDGGLGQFAAAKKAASKANLSLETKIVSFAKPESMVYGLKETPVKINDAPADIQKIIPAAISGTHDFAIRFHRQRRKKNFLNSAGL